MSRPRATTAPADPAGLADLDALPPDPAPAVAKRGPGRPRKATTTTAAGNKGKIPARTPAGKIMSKAEQMAAVHGQLMILAVPLAAVWEIRDPECAAILQEPIETGEDRLTAIVDRLVNIIARYDGVLAFMARSGVLVDLGMLATMLTPMLKRAWRYHGPAGIGHEVDAEAVQHDYQRSYPIFNPALSVA